MCNCMRRELETRTPPPSSPFVQDFVSLWFACNVRFLTQQLTFDRLCWANFTGISSRPWSGKPCFFAELNLMQLPVLRDLTLTCSSACMKLESPSLKVLDLTIDGALAWNETEDMDMPQLTKLAIHFKDKTRSDQVCCYKPHYSLSFLSLTQLVQIMYRRFFLGMFLWLLYEVLRRQSKVLDVRWTWGAKVQRCHKWLTGVMYVIRLFRSCYSSLSTVLHQVIKCPIIAIKLLFSWHILEYCHQCVS